jgi:hypothetical protein
MATFSKQLLSASTDGRAIKVVATAIASTPTLIHTGSSTASTFEEVWIYAQNNHSADVALRLGFGGVTDPDDIIEYTVKTKGGLYLIVPGLILKGNASAALTIRAAAGTANVISLSGYVNRITA